MAGTARGEPPAGYPFLPYDEGLKQAQAEGRRVFVYFGRLGCGWCDKTNREAFSVDRVRKIYPEHYVLVYVDAESGRRLTLPTGERITEMELGARFRVHATPVFIYLEPDGRQILKVAGIQTAQDFEEFDRFVHGEHYKTKRFSEFLSERP
jgi:thioredoxin-related protein